KPVGYSELIRQYGLEVMPNYVSSFIAEKGRSRTIIDGQLRTEIYKKGYDPGAGLKDHLIFALKYEGINLEILNALFLVVDQRELEDYIKETPRGKYARQIWFLYEYLTGKELSLESSRVTNYIDLLDRDKFYTCEGIPSRRHKVTDNLLGNQRFCPIIRRTDNLRNYIDLELDRKGMEVIGNYPEHVLQRAITYLYTKETKSSFEIERLTPDRKRAARFIELLRLADDQEFFNKYSLIELQKSIVDERFATNDFRTDQNYVGQAVNFREEIIHFIPPKPGDISELMEGMFDAYRRMISSGIHPVVIAAAISFGFVFVHPFDDGNGRIHRFLIHNILAKQRFTPEGLIFPVSATMLRKLKEYDETLELFSEPLLPLLDYELGSDGRMQIRNETMGHYQYIDMTIIAERLFGFIQDTIENEFVAELDFIIDYDKAKLAIREIVDMPDRLIDIFIRLCIENNGRLSKNMRKRKFVKLTDNEIARMEERLRDAFNSQKDV
ncbi:MAG: Fic family protein, partial [Candidatus Auribacterota bacterium]|nr:Fic family protein [Candidatus Auribacterota bacterium]